MAMSPWSDCHDHREIDPRAGLFPRPSAIGEAVERLHLAESRHRTFTPTMTCASKPWNLAHGQVSRPLRFGPVFLPK